MHDTVAVASTGAAAVVVVTEEFTSLALTMAANAGRSGLRVLALPYPLESRSADAVTSIAQEYFARLLDVLGAREVEQS